MGHYKNFRTAMYIRALDTASLGGDITPFTEDFNRLNAHLKVDKVYVETHRDLMIPDENTLKALKEFFHDQGIQVSAGITVTIKESDNFHTFCYSNPADRDKLREIVALSARFCDEIVFDDFFFTNCKCPRCIEAKGDRSWTDFRLALMTEASKELVLKTAKEVNPQSEVIIKYPNWYEHFQGLGFNLKDQPALYDGLYTGNETRDAMLSAQHLQPYESYLVFRYYENIKPGANRGGWVDPFGSLTLDRYAEQLWLTLFSKSPEITLFDFYSLHLPIQESQRGEWQDGDRSFSFDDVTFPVRDDKGKLTSRAVMAVAAGSALRQIDPIIGELGNPLGVATYKPANSRGEDFLHNYLGMLGIPLELYPYFPETEGPLLLTEACQSDSTVVDRIEARLREGKETIITSGLLTALQGKGIEGIAELECSHRKMISDKFVVGRKSRHVCRSEKPVLFPIIRYFTNDSWEQASLVTETTGTPILHSAAYGNSTLYVLTIPDDYNDLYALPREVLNRIRETVCADMFVRLDGPARVCLFAYDNKTFIVESFLDEKTDVTLHFDQDCTRVTDLTTQKSFEAVKDLTWEVQPHSFRLFRVE